MLNNLFDFKPSIATSRSSTVDVTWRQQMVGNDGRSFTKHRTSSFSLTEHGTIPPIRQVDSCIGYTVFKRVLYIAFTTLDTVCVSKGLSLGIYSRNSCFSLNTSKAKTSWS